MKRNLRSSHADSFSRSCFSLQDLRRRSIVPTAGLLFISPLGKHLGYVLRLHFPASNNVAEYEALVNGLRIAIELGVRRLDARGDS
jgi:ribonuclease HI